MNRNPRSSAWPQPSWKKAAGQKEMNSTMAIEVLKAIVQFNRTVNFDFIFFNPAFFCIKKLS